MNDHGTRQGHRADEQKRQHNGRVLLAEDDAINQKVIGHQLSTLGVSVDMASDGLEALALWRAGQATQRYVLLLTDLRMPGMDGYTLASTIRSEELAGARIPIVALSGSALRGDIDRYRFAGMDDFLTKPVRTEQLGDMIERWFPSDEASATAPSDPKDLENPLSRDVELDYVYDDLALEQLAGDDATLRADFRNMFVTSAYSSMEDMRRAANRGDCASLAELTRRLQSSAQTIGAVSLAACCDGLLGDLACGRAEVHHRVALIEKALGHATTRLSGRSF
ncbi:response regulator [Hydrogenophaga sp. BPS33]|uniref:response regulator n=1 Tax=Hydrogenophaga sp. BPS33 TaxID=2651974 RepID=UPI00131FA07B|nr:response regulator [Hydrogenophaga sp. BPS33]QHE87202.1 response regulator [Hydrogenophaga sp. BPS33]